MVWEDGGREAASYPIDPGCVVQLMVGISSRGRKQGCLQPCRDRPGTTGPVS